MKRMFFQKGVLTALLIALVCCSLHYGCLGQLASSRLLENIMTNGASFKDLVFALLFFLFRVVSLVILPGLMAVYMIYICHGFFGKKKMAAWCRQKKVVDR